MGDGNAPAGVGGMGGAGVGGMGGADMNAEEINMATSDAEDDYLEITYQSHYADINDDEINAIRAMPHSPSQTVGAIVRGFKSCVTKQINILRNTPHNPVWQRNYHEHIINNERFFYNVVNYIRLNPERWGKR